MRLRAAAVSDFARASPPFNPPSRPSATAAGFFFDLTFIAMPEASHIIQRACPSHPAAAAPTVARPAPRSICSFAVLPPVLLLRNS